MGVRNCAELGINLQKIISRLLTNDRLVNLLYYIDENPLEKKYLTQEQKKTEIAEKLIKTVPRVGSDDLAKPMVVVYVQGAHRITGNNEFKNVKILVDVFVPLTQWFIQDTNLRPFAILGEIQSSLDGKTVNGLGKILGGDFELNFVTDEAICYQQTFQITEYD